MSERKQPLYTISHRTEPSCGRDDCNAKENPEHWVDVELRPVAAAGPELLEACKEAQRLIKKIEREWAEGRLDMAVTEAVKFAYNDLKLAIRKGGGDQ